MGSQYLNIIQAVAILHATLIIARHRSIPVATYQFIYARKPA